MMKIRLPRRLIIVAGIIFISSIPSVYLSLPIPFSSTLWKTGHWFPLIRHPMLRSLESLPWSDYSSAQIREMMGKPLYWKDRDPELGPTGPMYYQTGFGDEVVIVGGWMSDSDISGVFIPSQFPYIWSIRKQIHMDRDYQTNRLMRRDELLRMNSASETPGNPNGIPTRPISPPRDHTGATEP